MARLVIDSPLAAASSFSGKRIDHADAVLGPLQAITPRLA